MSDNKRTSEVIVSEFNNLAFKAGNIQYEVHEKSKELTMINSTLRSLTLEYNKVKADEQAAQAATPQESETPSAA